jgi:signal transduction histidine kinase
MLDAISHVTAVDGFMPHGMCYLWRADVLSLHIVADALIAMAYFSIPFTLVHFARKRKDLKFQWMFVCFAVFIVACGTTHIMEIVVIWWPMYWASGIIKAITALASVPTALLLIRLLPQALQLPSPSALQQANAALESEVLERKRAESEVRRVNDILEARVTERTRQLEIANAELLAEVRGRQFVEQGLRVTQEQLREADRRKSEFIATLAHELRNPLGAIRNSVEIMKRKGEMEPGLHLARSIVDRQTRHLTHLLDDLLDVSRITRDKIALRREPFSLFDAVRDAVESITSKYTNQSVEIQQCEEPIVITGDATRIAQIIVNLLDNACKFSATGQSIRLAVERVGSEALIVVSDHGIGIAADQMPGIFEMFSQASPAPDRSQGGLGVGLALVHALVQLHGGSVRATSAGLGQGSEFAVRLPLAAAAT